MAETNALHLVENAQFTTEKPSEVREKIRGLLSAGEVRTREIVKFTSYSEAVISQWMNEKYEGDTEKIDDAVTRFYRHWIANNACVETSVLNDIHGVMMLAWKRKEICSITGRFGAGKTKSTSRFVALNDFAVYTELTSTTNATSLLHSIADGLGVNSQMVGPQHDKLMAIIRSLQRSPRLLVIDEADNLRPRTLAILKDIHGGETANRCAIVLVGTERLNKVLQHPELGYLRRRIRIKRRVGDIDFKEAQKIAAMWPHKLDLKDLKTAWDWSLKHFGVASLVALMARAYDVMQMNNKKAINGDHLEEAYSYLVD